MSEVKTKEPLIRIIKRDRSSFGYKVWVRAAAIILALVVDAVFIYSVTGLNPLSVYGTQSLSISVAPIGDANMRLRKVTFPKVIG